MKGSCSKSCFLSIFLLLTFILFSLIPVPPIVFLVLKNIKKKLILQFRSSQHLERPSERQRQLGLGRISHVSPASGCWSAQERFARVCGYSRRCCRGGGSDWNQQLFPTNGGFRRAYAANRTADDHTGGRARQPNRVRIGGNHLFVPQCARA